MSQQSLHLDFSCYIVLATIQDGIRISPGFDLSAAPSFSFARQFGAIRARKSITLCPCTQTRFRTSRRAPSSEEPGTSRPEAGWTRTHGTQPIRLSRARSPSSAVGPVVDRNGGCMTFWSYRLPAEAGTSHQCAR